MLTIRTLPWLLVLGIPVGCSESPYAPLEQRNLPITMGDPVSGEALPTVGMLIAHAMVSVDAAPAEDKNLGLCTGTLISPTAVLTAEHCVSAELLRQSLSQAKDEAGNPRNLKLEGEIGFRFTFARSIMEVMDGSAEVLEVTQIDEHQQFAPLRNPWTAFAPPPARWNDIAIVHLEKEVKERGFQRLAAPKQVEQLVSDEKTMYLVAGYGLTNDADMMSAGTLTSGVSRLGKVGDFELIAGEKDRQQACRGDSGGPIFTDTTDAFQIGIASRVNLPFGAGGGPNQGSEYPPCATGLVYTRVDAFSEWIAERVPDLPAPEEEGDEDGVVDAGMPDASADDEVKDSSDPGCSLSKAPRGGFPGPWHVGLFGSLFLLLVRSRSKARRGIDSTSRR